jgi:carboxybiotin decarboxylase
MALVPIIQPPVIRLLTTRAERRIRMEYKESTVPRYLKIAFPVMVTLISAFVAPISAPLVGSLMFGNLIRESGVLERLSQAAQNELANLVTLLLGITIGSTMTADKFLNLTTLMILGLGLGAFIFDTAGGVLFAKLLNLFLKDKINPMIGACGISAFPMSARVIQKMAQEEEKGNIILMHAVGANVAGQLGSIVAGGLVLALVPSAGPVIMKGRKFTEMDAFIESIRMAGTLNQAFAVMAGGLVGVFSTLFVFYIVIKLMEAAGGRHPA